jgi:hypothetical protein
MPAMKVCVETELKWAVLAISLMMLDGITREVLLVRPAVTNSAQLGDQ